MSARIAAATIAVAGVMSEPTHRSERVTESRCGERLTLLDRRAVGFDAWVRVRDADDYEGWVPAGSVAEVPLDWPGPDPIRVGAREVAATEPGARRILRRLSFGATLYRAQGANHGLAAVLPGGERCELPGDAEAPFYLPRGAERPAGSATLEAVVGGLLGTPYRWGGRSIHGLDCSGFVQLALAEMGLHLPRDAWQQERTALEAGTAVTREALALGDLVFWGTGERATHVGIALGVGSFAHARDWVRIGSWTEGADADLAAHFRSGFRIPALVPPSASHTR